MTSPVLVTPPALHVVELPDMRLHLRVDHDEEDSLIEVLERAAVGHLDGWKGVLGRAIMPQTWAEEFAGWGDLLLSMPDILSFTVTGFDAGGLPVVADSAELRQGSCGAVVCASGAAVTRVRVEYVCGLGAEQLPMAQVLVKMLAGHWYLNREAASANGLAEVPLAAQAMISAIRWGNV